MINLFFAFIISSFSCLLLDAQDGWFPVEKKRGAEEVFLEQNPSIWVLFSKEFEGEKIGIRFPSDPIYSYGEDGSLQVRSEKEGERFELLILKIGAEVPPLLEGVEHVVQTEDHVYYLRAYSPNEKSPSIDDFFASFSAQKNMLR